MKTFNQVIDVATANGGGERNVFLLDRKIKKRSSKYVNLTGVFKIQKVFPHAWHNNTLGSLAAPNYFVLGFLIVKRYFAIDHISKTSSRVAVRKS